MRTKINRLLILILPLCIWIFPNLHVHSQPNNFRLVWNDEFETDSIPDASKWGYDLGGGGWGNQELQYYTNRPENAKVDSGKLIITALKENYSGMNYTSARLVTRQKGDWLYGRIEVNAKLPAGRGTWPAIWMLPTDWEYGGWPASGELDIMEHVGYDMGNVHATIHTAAYNGALGTQKGNGIYISDVAEAFHTYAMEWSEDTIQFYADEVKYFTYINNHTNYTTWPFNKRFHLLLNIAIGGTWGGLQGVDDEIFPQTLEIDYVRVYEIFRWQSIHGPTKVDPFQENISFRINNFEGAVYTWTFPEGITLKNGQGTGAVTVDWNDQPGTVQVDQVYEEYSYTSTLDVGIIEQPGDGPVIIKSNEDEIGTWNTEPGEGNTIELKYED